MHTTVAKPPRHRLSAFMEGQGIEETYFTVWKLSGSALTRFAMPLRCILLDQHPFTVSSSSGSGRSCLRKKRWLRCIILCCVGGQHVSESLLLTPAYPASSSRVGFTPAITGPQTTMPFSLLRAPIPISTGFSQSFRYGDLITLYWSRPCALRHARHRHFLIATCTLTRRFRDRQPADGSRTLATPF